METFQLCAHAYSTNISIIMQKRARQRGVEGGREMRADKNTQIEKLKNDLKSTKATRNVRSYTLFVSLCRIYIRICD